MPTKLKMRLKYYIYKALGRGNVATVAVKQVRKTRDLNRLSKTPAEEWAHQVRVLHRSTVSATDTEKRVGHQHSASSRQAGLRTQRRAEEGEAGQHKEAVTLVGCRSRA